MGHLSEVGINVRSVVFDGNYANQETAKKLGCKLSAIDMIPYFAHPCHPDDKVYVVMDVCHMVKLMRNTLADYKVLRWDEDDGTSKYIKWFYIEKLHEIQEGEQHLLLGNKLKKKHIEWDKHKMNVRLAAQTLSTSVADAIDFLRVDLNHPEFQGSEETTKFIRKVDKLFDVLNSKNPHMKGSKAPLTIHNISETEDEVNKTIYYLLHLKDEKGRLMRASRRKTTFIGFALSSYSILSVAKDLLYKENPYKYVLTYKFSQDHLELFFNKIRQRGGWNNNPNALQFKWTLRKIMLKNKVCPSE